MGTLWNHVRKDLIRHRREPLTFFVWLGIPLLIGALFGLLFGGEEGPQPSARLLIVDDDQSLVSGLLVRALSEQNTRGFIRGETVDAELGRRLIADGEASALLTLPKGFANAVLREEPFTLPLLTNPAERILPRLVEETLGVLVDGHFYLHRLAGDDLRWLAGLDRPPTDVEIAALSGRLRARVTRLGTYLRPLLIKVEDEPAPADAPARAGSPMLQFFLPGLLFMALLFMAQGLGGREYWEERDQRTLHRSLVAPGGAWPFLVGKLVTAWLLMLAVAAVCLILAVLIYDLPARAFLPALVWASLAGAGLMAAFTLLSLAMPSARATNMLGMAIVFPLMMIGGSFFPFEAMPAWMAAVGKLTPNGWALLGLKAILAGTQSPAAFAGGLVAILAVTAGLTLVGTQRLRARFGRD